MSFIRQLRFKDASPLNRVITQRNYRGTSTPGGLRPNCNAQRHWPRAPIALRSGRSYPGERSASIFICTIAGLESAFLVVVETSSAFQITELNDHDQVHVAGW